MATEEVYLRPEDYELEARDQTARDLPFWRDLLLRERPRSVLEIGAGSGRLTLPLARVGAANGFTMTGLEMEPAMLDLARAHTEGEPVDVRAALRWALGDVRDLDSALTGEDKDAHLFDVILMPYGIAHHLLEVDDQVAAWRAARRRLRSGGLLAVEVTAPDLEQLRAGMGGPTPRQPDLDVSDTSGRALHRTVSRWYDSARQQETQDYEYDIHQPDGLRRTYRSPFAMHVYFPRELELLFRMTGFALERLIGTYASDPFGAGSPMMIGLGRALPAD